MLTCCPGCRETWEGGAAAGGAAPGGAVARGAVARGTVAATERDPRGRAHGEKPGRRRRRRVGGGAGGAERGAPRQGGGGVVQSLLRGSLLCASFPSVNISSNQDSVAYNIQHFESILENTKV